MTPEERKMRLGTGGLTLVAKLTQRTLGHVSQVNAGIRPDVVVADAITQLIVEKNPDIKPEAVWPMAG